MVDNIMQFIDPHLIKFMTHKDEVVGFILAFPDISAALQRTSGYVPPTPRWTPFRRPWRWWISCGKSAGRNGLR